jgi:Apea-like HEPN
MADASAPYTSTPDNSEDQAKGGLHALVEEMIKYAQGRGQHIDHHRHRSPYMDREYDEQFIRLNAFTDALHHIEVLPEVHQSYGVDEAERMVLQFLYAYLDDVPDLALDKQCFESIWSRFRRELSIAEWRHIGITILQNFRSPLGRIEIADDVAVCLRTLEDMQGTVGQDELGWLMEDWTQGARGSHALLVEHHEPKSPQNVFSTDAFHTVNKIHRALLPLRLLKEGDVRTGRFFFSRPALLPTRMPVQGSSGSASWRPGEEYQLNDHDLPRLRDYYALLLRFERFHAEAWKNVSIALRRFTAVYDNDWNQPEDRVIDAVIAIEALLGTDHEITYRLSTRVASILASSDDDRRALYKDMKLYYDTRSTIIHGGELKKKHHPVIQDSALLMKVVRRLLLGFLRVATGSSQFNKRKTFNEAIDELLLHAHDREEVRQAMGLA